MKNTSMAMTSHLSSASSSSSSSSSSSEAPSLPPPIPTGKGLRSAAGPIFSEYISKSIQIPELTLPEYLQQSSAPANIEYRSVVARDGILVKRFLRSAMEFGVFLVSGHGISVEELRSNLEETYPDCQGLVWSRSDKAMAQRAQQFLGTKKYRNFSQKMENVASRLEAIAEELNRVISENVLLQYGKRIEARESILSLYKYNHHTLMDQDLVVALSNEKVQESCEYALSLHLVTEQREFKVQSKSKCGTFSFKTSPDTIVVIVGKQLEDWSLGRFKSASGELTIEPDLHESRPSFSIELKFWPSKLNQGLGEMDKKISIADQILIILVLVFIHKILMFIFR